MNIQEQENATNVLSSSRAAPAGRGKRDKGQEVQALYDLMKPYARAQGKHILLCIPVPNTEDEARAYRLLSPDARAWTFNAFQELYGMSPLVQTYKEACTKIHASLLASMAPTSTTTKEYEKDTKKEETDELIERVLASANWTHTAIDVRATYARVNSPHSLRGLYRLDGVKTTRLTDAYVEVKRVTRPHSASKNARKSTLVLLLSNSRDIAKEFTVTDEQFTSNELANKIESFATYPKTDANKRYLQEAISALALVEGVQVQDMVDTLGWYTLDNKQLVWNSANGTETISGFIAGDDAPCLAPTIKSSGNGYYGKSLASDVFTSSTNVWELLDLYTCHDDIKALTLALISLSALTMLPDGIAPEGVGIEKGMVRLVIEIVGASRHGKSRLLNALLSLFGYQFLWDTSPIPTFVGGGGKGDTGIGVNGFMSQMQYHIYAEYDHKARPGHADFEKQHKHRNNTIETYVDSQGGGLRSNRTSETLTRANPSGAPIITSNYEHALTTLTGNDGEAIEYRACTFLWPNGVKGSNEVSREIDKHRLQIFGTGQAFRRWIMQRMHEPDMFREEIQNLYDIARATVHDDSTMEWASDYHRNHADLFVFGSYVWQAMLLDREEELGAPGRFLHAWIGAHIDTLVQNRYKRSQYIKQLVEERKEETALDSFVRETLRYLFSTHAIYIRSQQNALLAPTDVEDMPFSLSDIGYRSVSRVFNDGTHEENWEAGTLQIGYLVHKNTDIALDATIFIEVLRREAAKKNIPLPATTDVITQLVEKSMIVPYIKDGRVLRNQQQLKVNGKVMFLYCIPVDKIFTDVEVDVEDTQDVEDTLNEHSNVLLFPRAGQSPTSTSTSETKQIINGAPIENAPTVQYEQGHDVFTDFVEYEDD